MTTPYQYEFENCVNDTFKSLCNRYKSPELRAGFEIFAANVIANANQIKPRVPNRNYKKQKKE
jgi:hypothetical protein